MLSKNLRTSLFMAAIILLASSGGIFAQNVTANDELSFYGLGYGNLEFDGKILRQQASFYTDTNCNWIRFVDVNWNDIEPDAPISDEHVYNWEKLDFQISEWENAGFSVQITINPYSKWASKVLKDNSNSAKFLGIKDEYLADYKKFATALAARYNLDNISKINLKLPVLFYAVGFDMGSKDVFEINEKDFETFIVSTQEAVKKVNPDIKLIIAGFNLENIFDAEVKSKYFAGNPVPAQDLSFYLNRFLKLAKYCDIVEFKNDFGYTGLFEAYDYINTHMQELGINKPLWASVLLVNPVFTYKEKSYSEEYRKRAEYCLKIFSNKLNPKYKLTYDWMLAAQSNILIKKAVILKCLGVDKINFVSLEDWQKDNGFTGIADNQANKRPAFFALNLVQTILKDAQFVERIDLAQDTYAFKFEKGEKTIFVLWYESSFFYYPWETPPKRKIILDIEAKSAIVSKNIIKEKQKEPVRVTKPVRNNKLTLILDETPIFVEY